MIIRWCDRFTLAVMMVGAALLFQPWWRPGFQWGFLVLLAGTVAQIVVAHLPKGEQ